MCVNDELIWIHGWANEWTCPRNLTYPYTQTGAGGEGVEKSPFQIAAKLLEVDENVNWALFRTRWPTNNRTAFAKPSKEENVDQAYYVRSSSDLTTTVVMTLQWWFLSTH